MFVDIQMRQLNKAGEELCGDALAWHRGAEETVLVLADGLGSGVKANILATLTQKIALTLFKERLPLDDVVQTIAATLPTCKVRNLAYSTFTLVRIDHRTGEADFIEFDNPPIFFFKDGILTELEREERTIGGLTLHQSHTIVEEGDCLVAATDGLIHAGIGGIEPLGWRWTPIAQHLEAFLSQDPEAEEIAENLIGAARTLYRDRVGDDTTVAVLKCRPIREVVLAIGPPTSPEDDRAMVERFVTLPGIKIVCGGTTAKIVARELGRPLAVDLSTVDRELPPAGKIEGIDLVTEGVITMVQAVDLLDHVRLRPPRVHMHDLAHIYGGRDARTFIRGAARLPHIEQEEENPAKAIARHLRLADRVTILLGCARNPAHQNPNLPMQLGLKIHLIEHLVQKLQARGKQVDVVRY